MRTGSCIVALCVACGSSPPPATDAGPVADARPAPACGLALPALRPVASDEAAALGGRCAATPPRPFPTTGCVLDLTAHRPGAAGTCGAEVAAGLTPDQHPERPILIDGLVDLPLVIELPAAPGVDAACHRLCRTDGVPSETEFAIHFALVYPPQGGPFHHIRVEPPWRVVSGDEGSTSLCDNGRPSIPELLSNCNFTYVDNFALVTDDPDAPPARAIIEPDDVTTNDFSACCAYPRAP